MSYTTNDIKDIYEAYAKGHIDVDVTAYYLDEAMGGITKVTYKPQGFKLENHSKRKSIPNAIRGASMKDNIALIEVLVTDFGAIPEVHLSNSVSTKHHNRGWGTIIETYKNKRLGKQ